MMRVFLDLPLTEERLNTRGRLLITDSTLIEYITFPLQRTW